jgi:hypothetical protein
MSEETHNTTDRSPEVADATEELTAALDECEEKVDLLKRENRLLRDASRTFGALAERLNATLESERRTTGDRRTHPRQSGDRRQGASYAERTRG